MKHVSIYHRKSHTGPYLDVFFIDAHRRLRHKAFLRPVNVAQHHEESTLLESTAEETRIFQVLEGNAAVPLESQVHEVEVLSDDRVRRAGEVQRERVLDGAEVVELEDEVLREVLLGPPDDPSYADIGQSELVARGVNGNDARNAEVPLQLGGGEGSDETAGSAVDVDRNGVASLLFILVQEVGHLFDGFVMASVGA